jgi:hypothetical protein
MEESLVMEKPYLVCCWPWLGDGENITWDRIQAFDRGA